MATMKMVILDEKLKSPKTHEKQLYKRITVLLKNS